MTRLAIRLFSANLIALTVIFSNTVSQPAYSAPCTHPLLSTARPLTPLTPCDEDPIIPIPCDPSSAAPVESYGTTTLSNPAVGQYMQSTSDDPMATFSRRPLDHFIIPEGGRFLDHNDDGPHFGVDYANPDDYLDGLSTLVFPVGPGYVTARSDCWRCFVDGDGAGRVTRRASAYNFGFGSFVLVETPVSPYVSLYIMYAHLGRDWVGLGDYVTPDNPIGMVGSTGYAQEYHVHLEVRYGSPARFWNADFTQASTLGRWQATLFADPALLVFPQNHPALANKLAEWVALQPRARELP